MGKHAPLPPSSARRWINCPGSVRMCASLPDSDSVHSREGTFAHDIAARVLEQDLDLATELLGETDGEFTLDKDMAGYVQGYVNAVRRCVLLTDGELLIEQRVDLAPEVWGTADAVIFSEGRLDIFDLKYGAGIFVEVEGNEQLRIYALGALNTHPDLVARYSVTEVGLHIVQPRRLDSEGEAHRECTVLVEDLDTWCLNTVQPAIKEAHGEGAALRSGDWCGFCKRKATCSKLHEEALAAARDVFPTGDATDVVAPPSPDTFSVEDLSRILANAEIVETWLAAVRAHCHQQAERGVTIPGFKLVEKIGNRRWQKSVDVAAKLTSAGIDPHAAPKLVSPAEAERRLGGKKAAKEFIAQFTERPVTGSHLVPAAKAVGHEVVTLDDVFTDLDNAQESDA